MKKRLLLACLCLLLIFGCDGGSSEDNDFGTGGGSGEVVNFSYDCDSPDVHCPGAAKARDRWGDGVHEVKCAWSCALNTTDFKEPGFEDLSEPARHIITFRRVGDKCWKVHDVDTDKCGKDMDDDHSMLPIKMR